MADEQGTQPTEMTGDGNAPVGTGWAGPDQGLGENAESEIPVGVDQIEHEEPSGDDGGSAPVDVANLDVGDAEADAEAGTAEPEAEAGDAETSA